MDSGALYLDIVVDEGIIQVIADGRDGPQAQCSTAENASGWASIGVLFLQTLIQD